MKCECEKPTEYEDGICSDCGGRCQHFNVDSDRVCLDCAEHIRKEINEDHFEIRGAR